jgi:hypothetical protein
VVFKTFLTFQIKSKKVHMSLSKSNTKVLCFSSFKAAALVGHAFIIYFIVKSLSPVSAWISMRSQTDGALEFAISS